MSIMTPATVISIQYKVSYAKYKYLCVTHSSIVSLFVEWPLVAYNPLPFSDIFTYPMQVRDHACNISRALYRVLCLHILQPYGHNVIVFAFNRTIYQSSRPKWLHIQMYHLSHSITMNGMCTFFVFGQNVSASRPMNCFK